MSDTTRNKKRIRALARHAVTDLEALALLFEDDAIVDDGTVPGRLRTILQVTGRSTIPGLQTAIPFGDNGFAGERRLGSTGLKDPWPASRNQVGHFLTAAGLRFAPEIVSHPIPVLGCIRRIVGAPAMMSDEEVALRLAIGHEKAPDPPNALEAGLLVMSRAFVAARWAVARDGTIRIRARLIAQAMLVEIGLQILETLATFRTQFASTNEHDLAAWHEALRVGTRGDALNWRALEGRDSPLRAIAVAHGEGNSEQDLRLTLAGWHFGSMIASGTFLTRRATAAWIRRMLGELVTLP